MLVHKRIVSSPHGLYTMTNLSVFLGFFLGSFP